MAEVILVQGESGSGKSTSLRNMPIGKSVIITPNTKPLPFPGGDKNWGARKMFRKSLTELSASLDALGGEEPKKDSYKKIKYIIVEDFSHYMNERIQSPSFMSQGTGNSGFERWAVLARDVMHSIFYKAAELRSDLKIILLHHTEKDNEGRSVFRSFGKLLKEKLYPVSYIRIVLHSRVMHENKKLSERYVFQVNDDGLFEAKTPMGIFDKEFIPNDLYATLQRIEAYDKGELTETNTDSDDTSK